MDFVVRNGDGEEFEEFGSAVGDIEEAKRVLRNPGIGADRARMRWALHKIDEASMLISACSGGRWELSDSRFDVHGALAGYDAFAQACTDPSRNPFIEFFERTVVDRLFVDKPRVVGISISYFSQLIPAVALAKIVRRCVPGVRVIFGGAYLTQSAEDMVRVPVRALGVDAFVLHDGEVAFDNWLRNVLRGEGVLSSPNLYVADGDRYRCAGIGGCEFVDLDELPVPMWTSDGLDLSLYLTPRYPVGLPLSRGCYWGRCEYCNISSQASSKYRRRCVEKAVEDIRAIVGETGSRWFDFPVDSFRPKDLQQLGLGLLEAGIEIEWGAEVLLDPGFDATVVADLARSGCKCLRFGMESASADVLRKMNKPVRPEVAAKILALCREHGIRTAVMFIVGFPTETRGQLNETYDFIVENRDNIDFLTFHRYSLVVGSRMAKDPGAYGMYLRPGRAVFSPNLPFVNTNIGGMQEDHIVGAADLMRESLREYFPDIGELWTAGIGGWLTFANCCEGARFSGG